MRKVTVLYALVLVFQMLSSVFVAILVRKLYKSMTKVVQEGSK